MACPGRLSLLFLLVCFCVCLSIMPAYAAKANTKPPSSSSAVDKTIAKRSAPQTFSPELKEDLKKKGERALEIIKLTAKVAKPFLGLLPISGTCLAYLTAAVDFTLVVTDLKENPLLAAVELEFQKLNAKLDEFKVQQTWDTWASGAYYKPEKNINLGWTSYKTLFKDLNEAKTDKKKTERLKEEFLSKYAKYEPATRTLKGLLTAKGTTFTKKIGQVLADKVRCHEQVIRQYTIHIMLLIYKGNSMNQFYYKLAKTDSKAKVEEQAQIAYEAGLAMFQTHKDCIVNIMSYVEKDVLEMVKGTKDEKKEPEKIRLFLDKTYDRYEWMVVVYKTKKSKDRFFNSMAHHTVKGFNQFSKGENTVAVARMVKGTYEKAGTIKEAIVRCFRETPQCKDVPGKLDKCKVPYAAVHAFIYEGHDDYDGTAKYIHGGKCEGGLVGLIKSGAFVVMIKSDQELSPKDPCSGVTCGGAKRGKCVKLGELFLGVCECIEGYYGENCEESLDDYKKDLVADSPEETANKRG